jgi:hypothetical protein
MSGPAIWTAHARITDTAALNKLLAQLPEAIAANVRTLARPAGRGKGGMRWSQELRRAYFLQHRTDGVLSCVTFEAVPTAEKAAELWNAIEEEKPDMDGVCRVYAAVTGFGVEKVVHH